jgi:mannose-6-phosphate isomerase
MLSIQAHPTKAQAEAGFARENASGIPLSAPNRSYPDDNHKPEVHVALTDFWMLHGFRPFEETAEAMRSVPELGAVMPDFRRRLAAAGAEEEARGRLLRELYAAMMRMPQAEADSILSPLVSRLKKHPPTDKDSPDFWALSAARSHSRNGHHDRGIFSIYLLNLIHLRPGQGTYQPAGTLHAYLEGANVELMASSDNVLRGGLTTKYVDTEELMKTLSFESGAPSILEGRRISAARTDYPTPAAEFLLSRLEVRGNVSENVRASHGAECLIIMEGSARIESAGRTLTLSRGGIALVPAAIPYVVSAASATALLFRAGIPKASRSRPPRRGGAG